MFPSNRKVTYPLHVAVEENDLELVEFLLDKGINIDEKEPCGRTPLQIACAQGNLRMASYLVKRGATIDIANFENYTPLCLAAIGCHPHVVKYLLDLGAKVNPPLMSGSPLHEVCSRSGAGKMQERSEEVVQLLLERHADVSCNDCHYGTPLHAACSRPCPAVGVVERLLMSGANPNCPQNHRTPLHLIAQCSRSYDCALVLISYGANTELRDNHNKRPADLVTPGTPLHSLLLVKRQQPPSLCLLARIATRKIFGVERLKHLDELRLPFGLKSFLRHDTRPPCQCCHSTEIKT